MGKRNEISVGEERMMELLTRAIHSNCIIVDKRELVTHPLYDGSVSMGKMIAALQLDKYGYNVKDALYNYWGVESEPAALLLKNAHKLNDDAYGRLKLGAKVTDLPRMTERMYTLNSLVGHYISRHRWARQGILKNINK